MPRGSEARPALRRGLPELHEELHRARPPGAAVAGYTGGEPAGCAFEREAAKCRESGIPEIRGKIEPPGHPVELSTTIKPTLG